MEKIKFITRYDGPLCLSTKYEIENRCGNVISPDDFSNTKYEVLEAVLDERNELVKVVVQCLACKCDIVIVLK
jgi:hypothetical protein